MLATLGGVLVAIAAHFTTDRQLLPADAVASVQGVHIKRADYLQLLQQVGADRRSPLTAADRQRLLQRMIEERLLVQNSLELDLPRSNTGIRNAIVSSMLTLLVTDASTDTPADTHEASRRYLEQLRAVASVDVREANLASHASQP